MAEILFRSNKESTGTTHSLKSLKYKLRIINFYLFTIFILGSLIFITISTGIFQNEIRVCMNSQLLILIKRSHLINRILHIRHKCISRPKGFTIKQQVNTFFITTLFDTAQLCKITVTYLVRIVCYELAIFTLCRFLILSHSKSHFTLFIQFGFNQLFNDITYNRHIFRIKIFIIQISKNLIDQVRRDNLNIDLHRVLLDRQRSKLRFAFRSPLRCK